MCAFSPTVHALHQRLQIQQQLPFDIKFSDDTTIEGLITNADESAYTEEVEWVVDWCTNNDLQLNVAKTMGMIIDIRKNKTVMTPLINSEQQVELVDSFKFLGTTTTIS